MERGLQGQYVTISTAGERARAFVPSPLPPSPPVDWSPELQTQFAAAHAALGRLDGISSLLPETSVVLYSYVRQEAVLSSQIEGTQSSLSDLLLFENEGAPGVPIDDVQEVSNYVLALEPRLGVNVSGSFLQRMKTKWGGCNPQGRRIRLNTELVKKPKDLLEYVVVHEMLHLRVPTHSARYIALLDKHYPTWRETRAELNELPLTAEQWRG
jgi:hypothetical protein